MPILFRDGEGRIANEYQFEDVHFVNKNCCEPCNLIENRSVHDERSEDYDRSEM